MARYCERRHLTRKLLALVAATCAVIGTLMGCGQSDMTIPANAKPVQVQVEDVLGSADAIVTVISDDGFENAGCNLHWIFEERGLRCTVAGIVSVIDPYLDQWKEYTKNGVIDLVSHSYDHVFMSDNDPISQDVQQLTHQIVDADRYFEENWEKEQIVFVCPGNAMCELGYEVLRNNGFWAVRRGGGNGYNSLSPEEGTELGQWFCLDCAGIQGDGINTQVRNGWVDTAIEEHRWLIEMWHGVVGVELGGFQEILVPDAVEHVDYLAEKAKDNQIWVATFTEAVKYLREKQNIRVDAVTDGRYLHISSALTNDRMSPETFNQPLTVKITLPSRVYVWEKDFVRVERTEAGTVLYVDIVPNTDYKLRVFGIK